MPIYNAAIELDEIQEAIMLNAAAFFKMTVPDFLNAALQSGVAHAEQRVPDDVLYGPGDDLNQEIPF